MEREGQESKKKSYKFKELKVYGSTEWLASNQKKYRQVFDRYLTSYIYAELSFYNKLFDEASWKVKVNLNCYKLGETKRKICSLDFEKKVSKYDSIVHIREGWGNKKQGAFWKKGTYYWEAIIDGELATAKYFYVEDAGLAWKDIEKNPYFNFKSLRLYEGKYDDVIENEREYLKVFSHEETRYIYAEIILENKYLSNDWFLEMFVKFNNEAKELKGHISKLVEINRTENEIKITAGWGSNSPGSWRKGKYTLDLVFLDKLVATLPFEIGEEFSAGNNNIFLPYHSTPLLISEEEDPTISFDEVLGQLDALIGLNEIKQKVREHAKYIQFLQLRKEKGFKDPETINIHSVFTGNPGTGKTTVAKMMGKLYKKMGLLSKGHVHEVDRVDLVGEYIGQTAPKVKDAIEKAKGGILFIDEAYALARSNDDTKDFGREVIEILVKHMSKKDNEMAVIVAGYPKEMDHFINSNPGLKSRFKHFYSFRDYMPQELNDIAVFAAEEKEVVFSDQAKNALEKMIVRAFRDRDTTFGNARFVFDLVEKAKINLGLRVMDAKSPANLSKAKLAHIEETDVLKISESLENKGPEIPIDQELLEQSLAELDQLIGIEQVKKEIYELVEIIRYQKEQNKDVLNQFFLHTVFVGNPGTGKTTVARILAKIYKSLGLIERGHIVETDRQGLVAGFVGQTALKTNEKIDEAMGGVLFIDEAYTLSNFNGLQGDYGNEAIQTLLKRMEDDRGKFFVFVAGYPENMDAFLKANPGLRSRFDKTLLFDDYSSEELSQIATSMIYEMQYSLTPKASNLLKEFTDSLNAGRDKYFGNARTVRKYILSLIHQQNVRIAGLHKDGKKNIAVKQITQQDFIDVSASNEHAFYKRKHIGF